MSLSRVTQDGTFTQGTPIDLVTSDIFGLDDVSIDTDGTTYVAFASATGRRLAILSANSLSLIGFGPDFAINGSGKFATVQEGTPFIYIGYQDASRTVQVFAKGTTTPLITSSFAFSGIGKGYSVLEMIKMFELISGLKLNYQLGPRRPGDAESIYADNSKAIKILNWTPKRNLEMILQSAWNWERHRSI